MIATRTLTVTRPHRRRGLSLSLFTPVLTEDTPTFDTLPTEILLYIVSLALPQRGVKTPRSQRFSSKAGISSLGLINKRLSHIFASLLYRTVVLKSARAVSLFARTASTSPKLPAVHVKSLALTYVAEDYFASTHDEFGTILRTCSSLHTLVIPGPTLVALANMTRPLPAPKHVTIGSWGEGSAKCLEDLMRTQPNVVAPDLFRETTHLSVAEPGAVWARPRDILTAVGPLPQLTHLHLPRRAGANWENDKEFLKDIEQILDTRPSTKISVSVLPGLFMLVRDEDLGIKAQLAETRKDYERLTVREGTDGAWRRVWEGVQRGANGVGMEERFW